MRELEFGHRIVFMRGLEGDHGLEFRSGLEGDIGLEFMHVLGIRHVLVCRRELEFRYG